MAELTYKKSNNGYNQGSSLFCFVLDGGYDTVGDGQARVWADCYLYCSWGTSSTPFYGYSSQRGGWINGECLFWGEFAESGGSSWPSSASSWSGNSRTIGGTAYKQRAHVFSISKTITYDYGTTPSIPIRMTYTPQWTGGYAPSSSVDITGYVTLPEQAPPAQYFDLNGSLDGTGQGNISPMGTADVTIGGTKVLENGTDYYAQHAVGAAYTVNDIKANAGYTYTGNSSYTGTIGNSTTTVVLPFTTNSYTVSYNANGGSSTPSTQTAKYNTSVTLASAISKANTNSNVTITITYNANNGTGAPSASTGTAVNTTPYTFNKWALNGTSGTQYSAGASYTIPAANSTMYATWTTGTTTRKSNPSITLSSTKPTRAGYVFKGWSTSSTATSASYSAGTAYTFSANTTLYAVWEASPQGNIYIKKDGAWVLVSSKYIWANR